MKKYMCFVQNEGTGSVFHKSHFRDRCDDEFPAGCAGADLNAVLGPVQVNDQQSITRISFYLLVFSKETQPRGPRRRQLITTKRTQSRKFSIARKNVNYIVRCNVHVGKQFVFFLFISSVVKSFLLFFCLGLNINAR